ncbi:hypothetical protein BsWGS_16599 [Bradybaena similaris]
MSQWCLTVLYTQDEPVVSHSVVHPRWASGVSQCCTPKTTAQTSSLTKLQSQLQTHASYQCKRVAEGL